MCTSRQEYPEYHTRTQCPRLLKYVNLFQCTAVNVHEMVVTISQKLPGLFYVYSAMITNEDSIKDKKEHIQSTVNVHIAPIQEY